MKDFNIVIQINQLNLDLNKEKNGGAQTCILILDIDQLKFVVL